MSNRRAAKALRKAHGIISKVSLNIQAKYPETATHFGEIEAAIWSLVGFLEGWG